MNNEDKIIETINSLKLLTKHSKIKWITVKDYLNANWNESLRHYIINNNEYYDAHQYKRPYILDSKSYCTKIDNGIVYVFRFKFDQGDYYLLALQNNNSSNILELNNRNSNQKSLAELFAYIENQFDDIKPLIDSIISKSKKIKE